jgi:hypothetical protein
LVGHGAGAAGCADVAGGGAAAVFGFTAGFFLATGFLTGFIGLGGGAAGVKSTCTGFGRISGKPLLLEIG